MFLNQFIFHPKLIGVIINDEGPYNALIVLYDFSGKVIDLSYVDLQEGIQKKLEL